MIETATNTRPAKAAEAPAAATKRSDHSDATPSTARIKAAGSLATLCPRLNATPSRHAGRRPPGRCQLRFAPAAAPPGRPSMVAPSRLGPATPQVSLRARPRLKALSGPSAQRAALPAGQFSAGPAGRPRHLQFYDGAALAGHVRDRPTPRIRVRWLSDLGHRTKSTTAAGSAGRPRAPWAKRVPVEPAGAGKSLA